MESQGIDRLHALTSVKLATARVTAVTGQARKVQFGDSIPAWQTNLQAVKISIPGGPHLPSKWPLLLDCAAGSSVSSRTSEVRVPGPLGCWNSLPAHHLWQGRSHVLFAFK